MNKLRLLFILTALSFLGSKAANAAVALMENVRATNNSFFMSTSSYTVIGSTVQASTATLTVAGNISANCIQFPSGFQCIPVASTGSFINNQSAPQAGAVFNVSSGTATAFNATTIAVSTITPGNIVGTTTNNDAGAGDVGQYIAVVFGGVSSGSSGVYIDAGTITLTPGDWDVSFNNQLTASVAGTLTSWAVGISQTSGNATTGLVSGDNWQAPLPTFTSSVSNDGRPIVEWRQSVNTSTTIYAKAQVTFVSGTWQWAGRLSARRRR